ncbi:MAG TPA: periplasmic heavy metal sensor [Gemmatimonadaceae bacterium]|nr:periplasmic heavy metal sensor [Gemmatimonadaceae bacterium]
MAVVIGLMLVATSIARAQDPNREPMCVIDGNPHPARDCGPGGPRPPGGDPLARYLFPPELIMANQDAIHLTDSQRNSLQQAMTDAQGKFIAMQFKMSSEVERLQTLLKSSSVDETQVLEQVDRVLAVERDVKRAQLSLMIRIKNMLSAQQQSRLNQLRRQGPAE